MPFEITHLDLMRANILVTGGAGFIGSNFIRYVLKKTGFQGKLVNFDKLTYAGNLQSLADIDRTFGNKTYFFEQGDICDFERVASILITYQISVIVHFAAESHVDRSIFGPREFVETNVNGTFTLLEAARGTSKDTNILRFHHVSTDEVFGSLGDKGYFTETTPYDPRSPYAASKAASDHLVRAYFHTYGLPITVSNCSNNYGPYHFPEKLIPLIILNAMEVKPLPVYGDGNNIRDWLHVEDHCEAIWTILNKGVAGETYTIGGECEKRNIDVVNDVCGILEELYPIKNNSALRTSNSKLRTYKDLITFVNDRPGHDRRYAIKCDKIKRELGWKQQYTFDQGLSQTIRWFLDNMSWVDGVRSGDYAKWMEMNYSMRT